METRPDYRLDYHGILAASAPPAAPMAMPEQVLRRPRQRGFFLLSFRHWLARG